MLNISSEQGIAVDGENTASMKRLKPSGVGRLFVRNFLFFFFFVVAALFVPWTQNVQAPGEVISRYPDKKPQEINVMIDGRIVRWGVFEGQNVAAGDTLLVLEEVKPEYLDPQLVERTRFQIESKRAAIVAYSDKLSALMQQEEALIRSRDNEIEQAKLKVLQGYQKVSADSAMVDQERLNRQIAAERLNRAEELLREGLISTTDYETRSMSDQQSEAKYIKARNDLAANLQAYAMAKLEVSRKAAEYADKIAKIASDEATTEASMQEALQELTKLENTLSNYERRETGRVVLAPQEGRVVRITQSGVGEIVKAGQSVCTIQPVDFSEAVELYVNAMDVPLMHPDAYVRLQFDGWPALVFSGWPSATVGTFGGRVVSVDQVINDKGKYRVIIAPDLSEGGWPQPLSIGSGAFGMILLKDVPLGYELWRQLNGFPPEYYTAADVKKTDKEDKK
ncbi:MAG: hypothetical protein RL226_74 [Bacteroidota bacterium]|jgi:biotin carboxyl carrier protein